ncbi:Roadblock/LC7 domain-containing protein [Conidiobolus coronatus NRRL 28638]|uniref:Roadblock/LC7 domain-containing protein n=1 Tax=Conidiobolus coronatus (strain ATCC 28846 / CBS 209.66 / NRRL 28638) TaxID=796925 RepID=A0A137NUE0_CONC2|nr:Roadblock/LC7 domain-containing protein [Conidiobolus coronatus NRRL 28638]|eukprot:KXN66342.1 Roadblock/LC7 domain-containing protein [Conidiobolus coronatus NRRL 28638]
MSELNELLKELINRVDGLIGIVLTDRDGIVITSVSQDEHSTELIETLPLTSTYSLVSDQANKMGLGRSEILVSKFDNFQLVQFNYTEFFLNLISDEVNNIGILMDLKPELNSITDLISNLVKEVNPEEGEEEIENN